MQNQLEKDQLKLAGIDSTPAGYAWRLTKYYGELVIYNGVKVAALGLACLGLIEIGVLLCFKSPPDKPLG